MKEVLRQPEIIVTSCFLSWAAAIISLSRILLHAAAVKDNFTTFG